MGGTSTRNKNLLAGMRARHPKVGIFYYLDTGEKPRRGIPLLCVECMHYPGCSTEVDNTHSAASIPTSSRSTAGTSALAVCKVACSSCTRSR